jgi:hypothetical protein
MAYSGAIFSSISDSTFEDHIQKLEVVLKFLSEHGCHINAEKVPYVLTTSNISDIGLQRQVFNLCQKRLKQ